MDDLISRQAAIDEIDEWIKAFRENRHKESAADACLIQDGIIQLPSVHPKLPENWWKTDHGYMWLCPHCGLPVHSDFEECLRCGIKRPSAHTEIIRCKDCKHYNADFECLIEGYGIERDKDWFCADAERRTDG